MAFLYEAKRGVTTQVVTEDLFKGVLSMTMVKEAIANYRHMLDTMKFHEDSGNLEEAKKWKSKAGGLKSTLPGWIFSAKAMVDHEWIDSKKKSHGIGAWRHQDWALVNGLIMCDFDHLENPFQEYNDHIASLIATWGILFVFVTPSGHGLKVVFKGNAEIGDIAANQEAFAKAANMELDDVCKDASRLSFVTTKEDVIFLDKELFTYENENFIQKYTKEYFRGVSHPDMYGGNGVTVGTVSTGPVSGAGDSDDTGVGSSASGGESSPVVLDFSGYNYCGIEIKDIIDKLIGNAGIKEGKRHETLFQTAKMLRYVCERSDKKVEFFLRQLPWVQELDTEDHNVSRTIADAMAKPYSSYIPKNLKNALKELGYNEEEKHEIDELKPYIAWGKKLETYFDKFPCMAEACFNLEYGSYPAALFTAAAFFGTLMTRTWYHYWFQPLVERRLNYGVVIVGHPGSGKSFAGDLYKLICEPIIVADQIGNDAINQYKEEKIVNQTKSEKNKKDGVAPPRNIIRIHGPRTANGVFIEDMYYATDMVEGKKMHLHMLTFSAELDSMTQAQKGGQWIDKTTMELLAFHNEEDNQQYKNVESISGPFNVYWNFVYTGTPIALARKVNERNFGTGLFSRLGCLPMGSDYFEEAAERVITKAEETRNKTLRDWAYILDKVQGELPIKPLVHDTNKFVNEIKAMAKIDDNRAEAFLVNRVPYYGINVAVPYVFMRHYKEWEENKTFKCDRYDIELCRIFMEIQMHSQRQFFGRYAEMYFENSERDKTSRAYSTKTSKSDDLYNQLPKEFTIEDIQKKQEMTVNAARILVSRWKDAKRCVKISTKRGHEKWSKS